MAATYDLGADVASDSLTDQAPYWVVGIARFENPITYDPVQRASFSTSDDDAMQERKSLVLTSEVVQVQVSGAKESHVSNLTVHLAPSTNFLSLILPGDWIVCCMLNNEKDGLDVAARMRAKRAINNWDDGFKFLGRVGSVRKSVTVDRATGTNNTHFALNAVGFGEFNSRVLYYPQLQKGEIAGALFEEFGLDMLKIADGSHESIQDNLVDINKALPRLAQVIFGLGAWAKAKGTDDIPASPNTRFLVPRTVASWMGMSGAKTYADLLNIIVGLQHYRTRQNAVSGGDAPWTLFEPDGLELDGGVIRTPQKLIGMFPLAPPKTDGSVWDILSGFLNDPLNEMYVTLRAEPGDGLVMPHFIVRQTPYSSRKWYDEYKPTPERDLTSGLSLGTPKLALKGPSLPDTSLSAAPWDRPDVTEFLELPRWKVPSSIVYSADIGRSDALRFNLVHVSGVGQGVLTDEVGSFVRAPPLNDILDIKRSGLRAYMPSVNCFLKDLVTGPKAWRDIMADVVMGQHMMLTGTIVCAGIQAPIAYGDNLEFDGVVFHIENVAHSAGIDQDGRRRFETIVQVSHGVSAEHVGRDGPNSERAERFAGSSEDEENLLGSHGHITTEER